MTRLLHLSDIYYLTNAEELFAFLSKEKLHQIDALLITGITDTGEPAELIQRRILTEQLMQFFDLTAQNLLVQPSPQDLTQGHFNDCYYQPLMDHPYNTETIPVLKHGHLQICSVPTSSTQEIHASISQLQQIPLPDGALRIIVHYQPPYIWPVSPDQCGVPIHVSLHGAAKSRLYNTH